MVRDYAINTESKFFPLGTTIEIGEFPTIVSESQRIAIHIGKVIFFPSLVNPGQVFNPLGAAFGGPGHDIVLGPNQVELEMSGADIHPSIIKSIGIRRLAGENHRERIPMCFVMRALNQGGESGGKRYL